MKNKRAQEMRREEVCELCEEEKKIGTMLFGCEQCGRLFCSSCAHLDSGNYCLDCSPDEEG